VIIAATVAKFTVPDAQRKRRALSDRPLLMQRDGLALTPALSRVRQSGKGVTRSKSDVT
jgi:hypothetical protein